MAYYPSRHSITLENAERGGEAIKVTNIPSQRGAFSPDGKYVASLQLIPGGTVWQIAVIPLEGFNIASSSESPKLITPPSHFNFGSGL
ncbi:MAG TPA: hypothetical protein VJV03_19385, partial [Pyrinomonadaceae bacterium]|nr:hypothetical protein [Pyrinomonadaceae bacterium]